MVNTSKYLLFRILDIFSMKKQASYSTKKKRQERMKMTWTQKTKMANLASTLDLRWSMFGRPRADLRSTLGLPCVSVRFTGGSSKNTSCPYDNSPKASLSVYVLVADSQDGILE